MGWLETAFVIHLWPALLVWVVLYILDYVQTVRGARLYRDAGSGYIGIEGSYELNPFFEADIDRLRHFSPRFVLMLVVSTGALALYWWLTWQVGFLELFSILAGAMILQVAVVNTQHVRNIASYRYVQQHPGQIAGKVEYRRQLLMWNRAVEFGLFAALFAGLFAVTASWFLAGGALGMLAAAGRMLLWRRRAARAAETVPRTQADEPAPGDR